MGFKGEERVRIKYIVLLRAFLAAIVVVECSATPKESESEELDVYGRCLVNPNDWRQVALPPNREALLDLPEKVSGKPVRYWLKPGGELREAWFESSLSNELKVCRYDPNKSCYNGGIVINVPFNKPDLGWKAGAASVRVCSH